MSIDALSFAPLHLASLPLDQVNGIASHLDDPFCKLGTTVTDIWHELISEAEFPLEGKLATQIDGWFVLVGKTDDGFFAVNDRCTHQAALLSAGRIRRGAVMCPLHGARFELQSGRCIGNAYKDLRTFPLRLSEGMIEIAVPDAPPTMEEIPAEA